MHAHTTRRARARRPAATARRGCSPAGASALIGCDCLDWRVHGHVCVALPPPGQGESNEWRDIPGLRDPP